MERGRGRRCGRGRRGRGSSRGNGRKCNAENKQPDSAARGKKKKTDGNPHWRTISKDKIIVNWNVDRQFTENTGPSRLASVPETPFQFIQLFFTDAIFEKIAQETNLYFDYVKDKSGKALKFEKTNSNEIKAF